jgi:SAM-dependent methyltransferase
VPVEAQSGPEIAEPHSPDIMKGLGMKSKLPIPLRVWDRAFGWKRRNEAAATLKHAEAFLTPGTTVLDIGCGMGYALEVLDEDYGITSFGVDVVPSTHRLKRFARFDGNILPFADRSVDVAMLIFVLHHAEDAAALLREAARVARKGLLVVEDTPRTMFDRRWGEMHIRNFNRRHNIPWAGRIRTETEWKQLFRFAGLPLVSSGTLTRFERLPPVSRTAFVLQAPAEALPLNVALL